MIVAQQKANTGEALQEMEELLRAVAAKGSPHRLSAVRYTHCRAVLLDSELRSAMPGFLVQCVSIYKFHDFINLYDPKAEARVQFVDASFAKCRSIVSTPRTFDVFNDDF